MEARPGPKGKGRGGASMGVEPMRSSKGAGGGAGRRFGVEPSLGGQGKVTSPVQLSRNISPQMGSCGKYFVGALGERAPDSLSRRYCYPVGMQPTLLQQCSFLGQRSKPR